MVVLDTNFIIDCLNKQEKAVGHFFRLKERNEPMSITVINLYELEVGLRKSPHKEKNRNAIDEIKEIAKLLELDYRAIEIAIGLHNGLAEKGQIIDEFGIFIAAICIANNEKLVTRNVRDFEKIKGLQIETY